MSKKYCVYLHKDQSGQVRYVGKGKVNRPWNFSASCRSSAWVMFFSKNPPLVEILKGGLEEEEAFILERETIADLKSKGFDLLNICAGGYGGDSRTWTDEARARISELRKGSGSYWFGKKRDPEMIARMKETKRLNPKESYWKGKKRDPELIKKLAAAAHTPEAIAKREATKSLGDYGWTESRKEHLSKVMTGKDFGPDHGLKISSAKKGKPNGLFGRKMPEEHKAKISEATKGRVYGKEITDKARATKLARGNITSKAKAIRCKETGEIFRCATDAAEKLFEGKSHKVIQQCCTGSKPSYQGKRFEYV